MLQEGKGEGIISEPLDLMEKMFFKYYKKHEIKQLLKEANFKVIYEVERKARSGLELKQKKLFIIAKK
jgi:hypothetical protein